MAFRFPKRAPLAVGVWTWIALASAVAPVWADAAPPHGPEDLRARAGGAMPLDEATYQTLPKARHHRAWLPVSVDLSARFPAPGDQQWQGACTAWATGYAARSFLYSPQLGRAPKAESEIVSPEYIYNKIRPGPLQSCTTSGRIKDALDLLVDEGAATLSEFPYNIHTCQQLPPPSLKASASRFRIRAWRVIDHETPNDWRTPINLDDIKGQLAQGLPVVFTMLSPPDFYNKKTADIYRHSPSAADGAQYHAMALVGYDDEKQAVRLINSWGADWGDKGYAWIDYPTFKTLVREAYVIEPLGSSTGADGASPLAQAAAARAKSITDTDAALAALAAAPGCGQLSVQSDGGRRTFAGFVGSEADLGLLKQTALGIDPNLTWRVELHRWPQCEAQLSLQKVLGLGPVHLTVGDGAGVSVGVDPGDLHKGQLFSIAVETRPELPFVHLIYLQADGSAVELYRAAPPAGGDGRRRIVVGAQGKAGMRFQVAAPFGDEIILALASTGPLFDDRLGPRATDRQFLTDLRTRLIQARQDGTPLAADMVRLHTAP